MSQFGHETLKVYQESIRFIIWISELLIDADIFDSARGSALECAASLDVLVAKKKIDEDKVKKWKDQLYQRERSTVRDCFDVDRIDTR